LFSGKFYWLRTMVAKTNRVFDISGGGKAGSMNLPRLPIDET
jgi:hypothetical protein